ncbi:hypothetical protein FSP39_001620 [Pinctada imbricata]|uniref:Alpha/beta hydrolase fold-5 domain-containing protein n=1 Tax=Pinctada imbricata TaxID=66713 RepID=A0AA88YGY6_PINIB|nr:hypothetical protein FSP39_001620 [Pinctada imbricata]
MDSLKITILLSVVYSCSSLSVKLIHPIKNGTEVAVLIAPGAGIAGSAYNPLAVALQNESPMKLWVVLLDDFLVGAVNPPQLIQVVSMAKSSLMQAGFKSDEIYLAGHSLGGAMTAMYGFNGSGLKGAILFAAYLTNGNHLKDFPVPVLTISGDLDGLTRVTRIASSFEDLESFMKQDATAVYKTPVIVMSGVNHADFASGTMPSNVKDHDLKSELNQTEAQNTISKYTSAFLLCNMKNVEPTVVEYAKKVLVLAYNTTKALVTPLIEMKAMDENSQSSSNWTKIGQKMVINAVDNDEKNFATLEFYQPSADIQSEEAKIDTYTTVSLPFDPIDANPGPKSPEQLQAKMKTQESVSSKTHKTEYLKAATCKDINEAAFKYAMTKSSKEAISRFQKSGRKITFLNDTQTSSGPQWLAGNLNLKYSSSGMVVQSVVLKTNLDVILPSFAGQYYCKLLSPFRAMEFIYLDCMVPYY